MSTPQDPETTEVEGAPATGPVPPEAAAPIEPPADSPRPAEETAADRPPDPEPLAADPVHPEESAPETASAAAASADAEPLADEAEPAEAEEPGEAGVSPEDSGLAAGDSVLPEGSGSAEVAADVAVDVESLGESALVNSAPLADEAEPAEAEEPSEVVASSGNSEPAADDPAVAEEPGEVGVSPEDSEDGAEEVLPELADDEFEAALEALLLVVDSPAEEEALAGALGSSVGRVVETLHRLDQRYTERQSGIDLRRVGGGWRFYTRDRYAPYVERMLLDGQRSKLTRAALETLAVIAYRQPVTRARVAAVRGVNCDGVIRTLLARGLVEETGTDLETGGFLYRTTELFLERLGLSSLDDLPPIAPLLPEVDAIDDL